MEIMKQQIMKRKIILIFALFFLFILSGCTSKVGPQGEQGPKGEDGVSITKVEKTSTDGSVDTYTISFSDNSTFSFDIVNGVDGEPGGDGHSPVITISDEGNWLIDGVDTGKSSIGSQGGSGPQGVSIVSVSKTSTEGLIDTYTITYSNNTSTTFVVNNGKNGDTGKSAYELYCEEHKDYAGTLEEWLDEFYNQDNTDYSKYQNFIFNEVTYKGNLGYSATYFGNDLDIVFPESYKNKPVYVVNMSPTYEVVDHVNHQKTIIESISFAETNKVINFGQYYNEKYEEQVDFKLLFNGSIDEINGYTSLSKIYFDKSYDEFNTTNLRTVFKDAEYYCNNGFGEYVNYELINGIQKAILTNTDSNLFIKVEDETNHHIIYANEINFYEGTHDINIQYEDYLGNLKTTTFGTIMDGETHLTTSAHDVKIDLEANTINVSVSTTNYKEQINNNALLNFHNFTQAKSFGNTWQVYPGYEPYHLYKISTIDDFNEIVQVIYQSPVGSLSTTIVDSLTEPVQYFTIDKEVLLDIISEDIVIYYSFEEEKYGISSNNYYSIPVTVSLRPSYIEFFGMNLEYDEESGFYGIETLDLHGSMSNQYFRFVYNDEETTLYKSIDVSSFIDEYGYFSFDDVTNTYTHESIKRELYVVSFDPFNSVLEVTNINEMLIKQYIDAAFDSVFSEYQIHGPRIYGCPSDCEIELPTRVKIIGLNGVEIEELNLSYEIYSSVGSITLSGNKIIIPSDAQYYDNINVELIIDCSLNHDPYGYNVSVFCTGNE